MFVISLCKGWMMRYVSVPKLSSTISEAPIISHRNSLDLTSSIEISVFHFSLNQKWVNCIWFLAPFFSPSSSSTSPYGSYENIASHVRRRCHKRPSRGQKMGRWMKERTQTRMKTMRLLHRFSLFQLVSIFMASSYHPSPNPMNYRTNLGSSMSGIMKLSELRPQPPSPTAHPPIPLAVNHQYCNNLKLPARRIECQVWGLVARKSLSILVHVPNYRPLCSSIISL